MRSCEPRASSLRADARRSSACGRRGRVHDQGAAADDLLRPDDRARSCRRRACARTRARAATSPTRRATRSATSTCRRYAGINAPARPAPRLRPVPAAVAPRQEHPAVPGRGRSSGTARRSPSRRTSSTPAGRSSTRRRAPTRRSRGGSRTARPRTTRACPPVEHRAPTPVHDGRPDGAPGSTRTTTRRRTDFAHVQGQRANPRPRADVRRRQLPRHDGQRALPHLRQRRRQQIRWNYFAAADYLAATPAAERDRSGARSPPRRAAATTRAGRSSRRSTTRTTRRSLTWAQRPRRRPTPGTLDPAFLFFAQKVQPMLVKKGCMMAQCHSAAMFHDYRLRGGSAGSFSLTATQKNYALHHRADVVRERRRRRRAASCARTCSAPSCRARLERASPTAAARCSRTSATSSRQRRALRPGRSYDYDNGARRHDPRVLRDPRVAPARARRARPRGAHRHRLREPAHPAGARPPAGLRRLRRRREPAHRGGDARAAGGRHARGADQRGRPLGAAAWRAGPTSGGPAVSWDAKTIAFAARVDARAIPLAIYTINADGTGCAKQPDIADHPATRQRPPRARLRPGLQPSRTRRDASASSSPRRAATSTRQRLRLLRPAAHAGGSDEAQREPLRPRARPDQRRAARASAS